tara:strand:+ start:83 stop:1225 length:1143 start_codon:yes stop_codon:yes gene_type:complete
MLNNATNRVVSHEAKVIGRASHATTSLNVHAVTSKVRLIDIPGLEENTFKGLELAQICVGVIEEGRELLSTRKEDGGNYIRQTQIDKAHVDQVHAVVVCFPIEMLQNSESCAIVRQHLETLENLDYNPIVMMAKCDEVEPGIRDDPLAFDTFPELVKARQQISQLTGYPENTIIYSVSYTTEKKRTWAMDVLAYYNMKTWINAGRRLLKRKEEKGRRVQEDWVAKQIRREEHERRQQVLETEKNENHAMNEQENNEREHRTKSFNMLFVDTWMKGHGLAHFSSQMNEEGIEKMEELLHFTNEELLTMGKEFGMKRGHLKKFEINLEVARKAQQGDANASPASSTLFSNEKTADSCDTVVKSEDGGLMQQLGQALFNRFRR